MGSDPKGRLADAYRKALAKEAPEHVDVEVVFEKPRQPEHGDFACSIALQLAKRLKRNPRQLAEALTASAIAAYPLFKTDFLGYEIAGPGFINFRLNPAVKLGAIRLALQPHWGFVRKAKPDRVMVEFVSANPTGPLHVGHGRQAAIGDALAALIESQGDKVTREFYYNDAGAQIQNLALSVQARARGLKPGDAGWPADGYAGEYIAEIAKAYVGPDDVDSIRRFAVDYLRKEQDIDLREFGVKFDV
jgi:arginyl-tRNA synthetase